MTTLNPDELTPVECTIIAYVMDRPARIVEIIHNLAALTNTPDMRLSTIVQELARRRFLAVAKGNGGYNTYVAVRNVVLGNEPLP